MFLSKKIKFKMNKKIKWHQLTFGQIDYWSFANKVVLILTACLILFFLGIWYVIKPTFNKLTDVKNNEMFVQNQLLFKQKIDMSLKAYQQQLIILERFVNNTVYSMLKKSDSGRWIDQLAKQALVHSVQIDSIELLEEKAHEYYTEIPIKMNIQGKYHSIAFFVSDLVNQKNIVVINEFKMKSAKHGFFSSPLGYQIDNQFPLLTVELIIKIYYIPNNVSEKNPSIRQVSFH